MFKHEDYWPYIIGVFVFAGLIALPYVVMEFVLPNLDEPFKNIPEDRVRISCIAACVIFTVARTREGGISFLRLIGGIILAIYILQRELAQALAGSTPLILPVGLASWFLMAMSGWIGIGIARALGIPKLLAPRAPAMSKETLDPNSPVEPLKSNSQLDNEDSSYQFTTQMRDDLLARTRTAWLAGDLDFISPLIKDAKRVRDTKKFAKIFKRQLNAISAAFSSRPPESDEYLLSVVDAGPMVSQVLTNRAYYFFEIDERGLSRKYGSGKIPLASITKCVVKVRRFRLLGEITLTNGKTIAVQGIDETEPLETLAKCLTHNNVDSPGSKTT